MNSEVIVSVKEGKLRGIKKKSKFSGTEFFSFYGVPYGEAPVKNLRFKDPVKAKPWKSIRDAKEEYKNGCTQYSFISVLISGSEDCLYNNIHTSQLPSDGVPLKPVIFMIHPGGFRFGSPATNDYGSPDALMHHDVVYVCISYRLHIFGFLNLNMPNCSGNQGLKDIILGLQWVQENIHNFNGDPNNVTLYGTSSGGFAVNLLLLSPAAKGLFHKAVMTSSTYVSLVYAEYQDENETLAFRLGDALGFQGTNRKHLLKFLKKLPAEMLTMVQRDCEKLYTKTIAPVYPQSIFLPTIDAASKTPVIPISPRKLIDSFTPVPLIFGICERESGGFSSERIRILTEANYRTAYRQNQWSWMYDLDDNEMKLLHDQVERFYLKGSSFEDAPLSVRIDMMTEIAYHDVYDTLINPIAEKFPSSVYLYRFRFDTNISRFKAFMSGLLKEKLTGSFHSCDFACINDTHTYVILSERDIKMIETYTKLITTFAKNCDPNYEQLEVRWRPSTVEKPCYLSINDESQMVDGEYFQESVDFWKNIKKQFKHD